MKNWNKNILPKAIFSDIDGTLNFDHNFNFDKNIINAFKKLQEKNVYSVLITGNNLDATKKFQEQIYFNEYGRYAISSSGAVVYDCLLKKNIIEESFSKESQDKWLKWAFKNKFLISVDNSNAVFTYGNFLILFFKNLRKTFLKIDPKFEKFKSYKKITKNKLFCKIDLWTLLSKEQALLAFSEAKNLFPELELNLMDGNSLQATNKNVSKGRALEKLSKYLDFSPQESVAIGDSMNDISMFKVAGMSIALGNASEELKKYATYHTDRYDNSGFVLAIEKIINSSNG